MSYGNENPFATPALDTSPPPPRRAAREPKGIYRSAEGAGLFAIIMLVANVLFDLVVAGNQMHELSLINSLLRGARVTRESLQFSAFMGILLLVGGLVTLVLSAIAVLTWFYQAHRNLPALRSGRLEFTPGWAAGGFFVPILNLFRPYQVMQEIWCKSDPKQLQSKKRVNNPLAGVWWACWIAAGVLGNVAIQMAIQGRTVGPAQLKTLQMAAMVDMMRVAAHLPAAVVLASLIWKIGQNQEARHKLVRRKEQEEQASAAIPVAQPADYSQPLPVAMPFVPQAPGSAMPVVPPPPPRRPPPVRGRPAPPNPFAE